jgi:hypothetical protein
LVLSSNSSATKIGKLKYISFSDNKIHENRWEARFALVATVFWNDPSMIGGMGKRDRKTL